MTLGTWLLSDRVTGLLLLALVGMQGFTMRLAPGALRLQKPEGGTIAWVYNAFNLALLLGLTPLAAGCLLVGARDLVSWGQWSVPGSALFSISRSIGLATYLFGCFLMLWSRIVLGRSFRLGAVRPDPADQLVASGPFRLVRHPMYSAVMLMAFGLSFLLNSWVVLGLAVLFGVIVLRVIPIEEAQLESAYADAYRTLRSRTWCLVPWVC